jgi:hypothetical protein
MENEDQHKTCSWKHHKKRQQLLKQLCLSYLICGIQYESLQKHSSFIKSSILNMLITPPNEINKALKLQLTQEDWPKQTNEKIDQWKQEWTAIAPPIVDLTWCKSK